MHNCPSCGQDIPDAAPIDDDFLRLYVELATMLYATEPEERLGIIQPFLRERYGNPSSDTYRRIESHLLRTVAWMELWETDPEDLATYWEE